MGSFDGASAPIKTIKIKGFSGTQDLISLDNSVYRTGCWSLLTAGAGANIWVLAGNQPIMFAKYHNFEIDGAGNLLGRDETDSCSMELWCEDNTIRYFSAPSGPKGSTPVMVASFMIDMLATYGTEPRPGAVGQIISATIATPGTSLTTATPANVILTPFLALTPGRWDIYGQIAFLPAATTSITQLAFGISATSATLPAAGSAGLVQNTFTAFVPGAIPQCNNVTITRVNISANTTYYLVAQAAFTVSTLSAFGTLYAERR